MSLPSSSNSTDAKVLLEQMRTIVADEKDTFLPENNKYLIDRISPGIAVLPSTPEQIAAILKLARDNHFAVVPAGGMTKQTIGNRPVNIDILMLTGRLRSLKYDFAHSTITANAGVTIAELHAKLVGSPHFLPLDPMMPDRATVGGILATAEHSSGPLRSGYGGAWDFCLSIELVTADGKVITAVHHLRRLMIGSFGTLGIITSATFRLFAKPEHTRTFIAEFSDPEDAMRCRDQVMATGITPMCLEIASPRAQEYLQEVNPPRDPDVYAPLAPVKAIPWKVILRAGGEEKDIEHCRKACNAFAPTEVQGATEQLLWQRVADWESAVAARHRNATILHVSVAVGEVSSALAAAEQTAVEHNLLFAAIGRISVGAILVAFLPLGVDPVSAMQCAIATSAFRGRLPEEASAVVARCPPEAKDYFNVWGSTPTGMQLMRMVRETFDPEGILNRGRFIV